MVRTQRSVPKRRRAHRRGMRRAEGRQMVTDDPGHRGTMFWPKLRPKNLGEEERLKKAEPPGR